MYDTLPQPPSSAPWDVLASTTPSGAPASDACCAKLADNPVQMWECKSAPQFFCSDLYTAKTPADVARGVFSLPAWVQNGGMALAGLAILAFGLYSAVEN